EITEQKKSEWALRQSEQKFRLLAENVPGVIYLCHNDKTFTNLFISKNIERMTGYSTEEFLNGSIDIQHLIHEDDKDQVNVWFHEALIQHRSFNFEYRIVNRAGEIRW